MKTGTIVMLGILGLSLAGATVMQAVTARGPVLTTAAGPSRPEARRVAAEGRVVTYPGSEVVVGAERSGRLVRVAVEEGQALCTVHADSVGELAYAFEYASANLDIILVGEP